MRSDVCMFEYESCFLCLGFRVLELRARGRNPNFCFTDLSHVSSGNPIFLSFFFLLFCFLFIYLLVCFLLDALSFIFVGFVYMIKRKLSRFGEFLEKINHSDE